MPALPYHFKDSDYSIVITDPRLPRLWINYLSNGKIHAFAATEFRHTGAPIGNIDQFCWLSRAAVQRQLVMARDELGVSHGRACAMFSPEMAVWDYGLVDWRKPDAEKTNHGNWQLIDLSIEPLLDLGLKPIYTTCFTPVGMSDDPTICWPDQNLSGSAGCPSPEATNC